MYLSKLTLNPRPACKEVLRDLASPYEMHRTIMRAFPGASDGGPGRVLFRLEPTRPGQSPVVLVQSDKAPDWSRLADLPEYLAAEPQCKQVDLAVSLDRLLRFRLRANVTVKREGKRHGLYREEDQRAWLARKGKVGGFDPTDVTIRSAGEVTSHKVTGNGRRTRQTHFAVDYEGVLGVTDADRFVKTLAAGIGPAKAYGFGLLSVAPA